MLNCSQSLSTEALAMRKSLWTPVIASVLIGSSAAGYYLLSDYKALETKQAVIAAAPFEQLSLSQMSDKRILTLQDKL